MCFDPQLKAELEAQLEETILELGREIVACKTGKVTERMRELSRTKQELKDKIFSIPHKFSVGDGAHTGSNGDRYPYRVKEVSDSGKSVKVVRMNYRAVGENLPMGHQEWEVFDYENQDDMGTETYTLRKNGRWIRKGCSMSAYWMGLYPGACYSYNWEF